MRCICLLLTGIHNQKQMFAAARNHQVIKDATGGIGELGVAHPPRLEPGEIAGHQALERRCSSIEIVGLDTDLPHMGNIEQPGMLTGVLMLGDDSGGILDRHFISGERHHFGTQLAMQIREWCALEGIG
jgi:hypothetical protein